MSLPNVSKLNLALAVSTHTTELATSGHMTFSMAARAPAYLAVLPF